MMMIHTPPPSPPPLYFLILALFPFKFNTYFSILPAQPWKKNLPSSPIRVSLVEIYVQDYLLYPMSPVPEYGVRYFQDTPSACTLCELHYKTVI